MTEQAETTTDVDWVEELDAVDEDTAYVIVRRRDGTRVTVLIPRKRLLDIPTPKGVEHLDVGR